MWNPRLHKLPHNLLLWKKHNHPHFNHVHMETHLYNQKQCYQNLLGLLQSQDHPCNHCLILRRTQLLQQFILMCMSPPRIVRHLYSLSASELGHRFFVRCSSSPNNPFSMFSYSPTFRKVEPTLASSATHMTTATVRPLQSNPSSTHTTPRTGGGTLKWMGKSSGVRSPIFFSCSVIFCPGQRASLPRVVGFWTSQVLPRASSTNRTSARFSFLHEILEITQNFRCWSSWRFGFR